MPASDDLTPVNKDVAELKMTQPQLENLHPKVQEYYRLLYAELCKLERDGSLQDAMSSEPFVTIVSKITDELFTLSRRLIEDKILKQKDVTKLQDDIQKNIHNFITSFSDDKHYRLSRENLEKIKFALHGIAQCLSGCFVEVELLGVGLSETSEKQPSEKAWEDAKKTCQLVMQITSGLWELPGDEELLIKANNGCPIARYSTDEARRTESVMIGFYNRALDRDFNKTTLIALRERLAFFEKLLETDNKEPWNKTPYAARELRHLYYDIVDFCYSYFVGLNLVNRYGEVVIGDFPELAGRIGPHPSLMVHLMISHTVTEILKSYILNAKYYTDVSDNAICYDLVPLLSQSALPLCMYFSGLMLKLWRPEAQELMSLRQQYIMLSPPRGYKEIPVAYQDMRKDPDGHLSSVNLADPRTYQLEKIALKLELKPVDRVPVFNIILPYFVKSLSASSPLEILKHHHKHNFAIYQEFFHIALMIYGPMQCGGQALRGGGHAYLVHGIDMANELIFISDPWGFKRRIETTLFLRECGPDFELLHAEKLSPNALNLMKTANSTELLSTAWQNAIKDFLIAVMQQLNSEYKYSDTVLPFYILNSRPREFNAEKSEFLNEFYLHTLRAVKENDARSKKSSGPRESSGKALINIVLMAGLTTTYSSKICALLESWLLETNDADLIAMLNISLGIIYGKSGNERAAKAYLIAAIKHDQGTFIGCLMYFYNLHSAEYTNANKSTFFISTGKLVNSESLMLLMIGLTYQCHSIETLKATDATLENLNTIIAHPKYSWDYLWKNKGNYFDFDGVDRKKRAIYFNNALKHCVKYLKKLEADMKNGIGRTFIDGEWEDETTVPKAEHAEISSMITELEAKAQKFDMITIPLKNH